MKTNDTITLAHGGGGRMTQQLLDDILLPAFTNPELDRRHDGAVFTPGPGRAAFTTDSYVVQPMFFPGGDIGKLAVYGTVNDLAMCGARPQQLSCGLILEEGLPVETLKRIAVSMREAAVECGVQIVTGDTKVVDRGKGDGVYINTAGVGAMATEAEIGPRAVQAGDVILLSGDIGRHGVAIMAQREGLNFETEIASDCANLAPVALALLEGGVDVHCLRDCTRGGLASALIEVAQAAGHEILLRETDIDVSPGVHATCEVLGLDPLHIANEGRMIAIVAADGAARACDLMRAQEVAAETVAIGEVLESENGRVRLENAFGSQRILDMFSGEQLPRIC